MQILLDFMFFFAIIGVVEEGKRCIYIHLSYKGKRVKSQRFLIIIILGFKVDARIAFTFLIYREVPYYSTAKKA